MKKDHRRGKTSELVDAMYPFKSRTLTTIPNPTIDELLEEIGEDFCSLQINPLPSYMGLGNWIAYAYGMNGPVSGATAREALINLWLAIKKKK